MIKIGVTSATICARPELQARVTQHLPGLQVYFRRPEDDLKAFISGLDGLLIGRELITDELLNAAPRLRAISVYGVGYDNVDEAACRTRGVRLLVTPGVNAAAVAEHTLGLILAVGRNIAQNDQLLHQGVWNKNGGRSLYGKTVAVVGCGAVGSRVARLLQAFGCNLILVDILQKTELALELAGCEMSLDDALALADIITLHVPLTEGTRQMFDDRAFAQAKRGSVLINTSRGGVVSLAAVKRALESGQLSGAGLDVFEIEPIVDPDLFAYRGVVGTPHTAGNALEAVEAMTDSAATALASFFQTI